MKKLVLSAVAILACSISILAQSNLVFYSEQGEKFYVVLNGIRQNAEAETNVKVTDLPQPYYKTKIIFENESLPQIDKMVNFNQGMESVFAIKQNKKGDYVLRWQSETPIAQAPPPAPSQSVVTYTTTAPAVSMSVTETTTTTTTTGGSSGDNVSVGFEMGGMGMNMNVNINDPYMNGSSQTTSSYSTTTTTTTTSSQPATTTAVVTSSGGCDFPMSPGDFASAKRSISSKTFEDSQMKMAKQIFNSNCLTSEQVKEIMMIFTFEDGKLEFAKYAYGYTYDPNNYWKVNDAFEFESSIEELDQYIQRR